MHEFKLGHNASQNAAKINRVWGEVSICDRTVRRWFLFCSGDMSFNVPSGRGCPSATDNQYLEPLVKESRREIVREMSQKISNIGKSQGNFHDDET